MRLSPLAPLTVAAALVTTVLSAESTSSAIATPPPALDRRRAVSPATAARIAAQLPKFVPPQSPATPGEDSPILASPTPAAPAAASDADQPRNAIVRLPNYVVQEEKPATFKEREILTFEGRLALAYQRQPGLKLGSLLSLGNESVALAMLEEDHRLERKAEMENLSGVLTNSIDRAKAKNEARITFLRPGKSGFDGMGPK
jgi:hypothetical protein